jgi:hypothetical protein
MVSSVLPDALFLSNKSCCALKRRLTGYTDGRDGVENKKILTPTVYRTPSPRLPSPYSLVIIMTELSRLFHMFVQINAQSKHWF